MASYSIQIPFRRSHNVDISSAIKQYISTRYDESHEKYADDVRAFEQLRQDCISVLEPHVSGIDRLARYSAQLRYMSGKFPVDIGVEFPWYPALGYHTNTAILQSNLRFELANILYNLAALYSQLALANNRTTSEGLKQAAQYGMAAAGTLAFLRKDILPDLRSSPPEDMDPNTLESLENLSLAQAQECFWQKAVKDGMKDGTIARLAAKVSDYYGDAGDCAVKSDCISTEWIHHMNARHHHFASSAQYRQSIDCLEKRKYGEEVARLRDALACANEGLKEARWINRVVLGDLNGLKTKIQEELKRAEKDNDMIYLLPVVPKSELKTLDRANMVAPRPPKEVGEGMSMLGPNGKFGMPLFERLVPYAVHQAASIYTDRRDRLVNTTIIADLEAMTSKIRDLLQSLNLPGSLQALEKPLGLPPSLVSKAEELRQQDALYRLKRSSEDTLKLKTNDLSIYQEGVALLESEKQEDDRARAKYGTERWTRIPSQQALVKFYTQAKELQGYLNSAGSSDSLVQTKIRENEHVLRILTGSNRELERHVPSSSHVNITPKIEQAASRLRAVLNDTSRLETKRKRKVEAIRAKAKSDDISPDLLAEAARLEREFPMQPISAAQFEPLFESRLDNYEADREMLVTDQEEQDQLFARVREANKNFLDARKGDAASITRDREQALQELETAYLKYKEIISNLETGRKFYNDLAGHVGRFREAVRNAVAARRQEASELEAEIGMDGMRLEETTRQLRQRKKDEQKPMQVGHHHQVQGIHHQEPLTAPVATRAVNNPSAADVINTATSPPNPGPGNSQPKFPVGSGVWSPDMGIKFGGPPGSSNGYNG